MTNMYLEFQPEQLDMLTSNGIKIEEVLDQYQIEASVTYGVIPDKDCSDIRTKDIAMVVVASSAVVLAVGTTISKILHTLQRRPQLVEYYDLVEVSQAGEPPHHNGNSLPKYTRVKKYELLEPRKENSSQSMEIKIGPKDGLVIRFSSTELQGGTEGPQKSNLKRG